MALYGHHQGRHKVGDGEDASPLLFLEKMPKSLKSYNIRSNILSTSPHYPPDYFSGCDIHAAVNKLLLKKLQKI